MHFEPIWKIRKLGISWKLSVYWEYIEHESCWNCWDLGCGDNMFETLTLKSAIEDKVAYHEYVWAQESWQILEVRISLCEVKSWKAERDWISRHRCELDYIVNYTSYPRS